MKKTIRLLTFSAICAVWAATASAQSTPQSTTPQSTDNATRPATPTFTGDTGLWFAPTAEVLPSNKLSVSGYRRATNYFQGLTNVGDFAGTFSVGIKNRAEVFGSFLFDTRIDRELKPIFVNDPEYGSFLAAYPRVRQSWTGNNVGDFYLGAKVNLWSQYQQRPVALAVRGALKLPTGDDEVGVSTGKLDGQVDFVVSKYSRGIEGTGYFGMAFRGTPDGFDTPSSAIRWGTGVGVPLLLGFRGTAEINGTLETGDDATLAGATLIGLDGDHADGSVATGPSKTVSLTRATLGVTWHHRSGFFIGAAGNLNLPAKSSDNLALGRHEAYDPDSWDYATLQVRLGYHPGVRVYVPPPPPPPPAPPPPPPAAPQNRPPTVTAQCDPCTVAPGGTSTVTAVGADPDGDPLTYAWTAPAGTFTNATARVTPWTAPQQEGPVVATVTVNDGRGGTARATTTIQVVRPPAPVVRNYTFDDVYFDFDRYSLRPEATRILDEAIAAMGQDATLRVQIEGHTCNIGTAEYNLALGDRRANQVRDYFISRGVAAARLTTVSYGEERPKHDNSREETRRLNRRAALVVNLQR